ncbi:hypothetical protein vBVpaMR16F_3 [Vibrio phage vB_VpaM_R16F]|nr:hypothetical protein vBVpaMR16F_3 [Vibrio phage vB_VpaM_R16F]
MLYIAKLTKDNKSFIKLGYTKHNTTDKRFKPYRDYFDKVELLDTYKQDRNFYDMEIDLHIILSHFQIDTGFNFGGKTECYGLSSYDLIKRTIEENLYKSRYDLPNKTYLANFLEPQERLCDHINLEAVKGGSYKETIRLNDVEDVSIIKRLFELKRDLDKVLSTFDEDIINHNVKLLEKLHYESDPTKEIITISEDEFQEFEAFIKQQETEKYFDELEKEYKKDL